MKKVPEWAPLDIPSQDMLARRAEIVSYNIGYEDGLRAGRAEPLAKDSSSKPTIGYSYDVRVSEKLIARMQGCRCMECQVMVSLVERKKDGK